MAISSSIISWIHDIMSLIHCIVMTIISFYLYPSYIVAPLGNLSSPELHFLKKFMLFSMGYFSLSLFIIIFLEPFTKRSIQYIVHHILTLLIPGMVLLTHKYSNLSAGCYFIEISSIFLGLRSLLRRLNVKGIVFNVIEILFVLTFFVSRMTFPYYMTYHMIIGFFDHYTDLHFIGLCLVAVIGNLLNLVWGYEILTMMYRKYSDRPIHPCHPRNSGPRFNI
jgi:hypothetical protein